MEFLPTTDLSEYLKTEKLLEGWYMLSNKDISVLIEPISARIRAIYAHGRFGRLQKLLYDTRTISSEGWGFSPVYKSYDSEYSPPLYHTSPKKVIFEKKENKLILEEIPCYDKDKKEGPSIQKIEIWLKGHQINYSIIYFPERMQSRRGMFREPPEISSCWYPLYTHYQGEKSKQIPPIPYSENRFYDIVGKEIVLTDKKGRLPGLKISSNNGYCILSSEKDIVRGNARRLRVFIRQPQLKDQITIKLIPNPITIKANPYYHTGERKIEIYSSVRPEVKINKKRIEAKLVEEGKYTIEADLHSEGKYKITAKSKTGQSELLFYAIGNPLSKIIKMGEAATNIFWRKPPLKDIIAAAYHLNPVRPAIPMEDIPYHTTAMPYSAYISHAGRVFPILAAASCASGNQKYLNKAFDGLKALVKKAHHFRDGSLLLPIILDKKGKSFSRYLPFCRASDLGIMVRAFLYTYYGFKYFKDDKKANQCLDYAYRYAHTLTKVQLTDGNFPARYSYPELKATTKLQGTVNPWLIQVWELANVFEKMDKKKEKILRNICIRYADYLTTKRKPTILKICDSGADEGGANYYIPFSFISLSWLIKYFSTGDKKYAKYAKETFKMAFLTSPMYIDQPQTSYWITGNGPAFASWYGLPALINSGGYGKMEGLFLKKYLNYDLGKHISSYIFADTLAERVLPDGGICGLIIDVPGFKNRLDTAGETLCYLHMGVYANWYIARKLLKCDSIFQR